MEREISIRVEVVVHDVADLDAIREDLADRARRAVEKSMNVKKVLHAGTVLRRP